MNDILENWQQYAENVRHEWEKKWAETITGAVPGEVTIPETVTIGDITANPSLFVGVEVTVRGTIQAETTWTGAVEYYLVSNGARIRVAGDINFEAYEDAEVEVTGEVEIGVGPGGPQVSVEIVHITLVGAG